MWLGVLALQIGAKGPRIGIGHSAMKTLLFCLGIQAIDAVGVVLFQRQGEWPVNRAHSQNPVARQAWKPD